MKDNRTANGKINRKIKKQENKLTNKNKR
jgi:hypothetical protein